MADINIDSIRVVAKPITIPEHMEYQDVRLTVDSGEILQDGDKVRVAMQIYDKNNVQRGATKIVWYRFPKMPIDPALEILGAVSIGFVESPKPVIVTP